MVRSLIPTLLLVALMATPTIRAQAPDEPAPADTAEKIVAVLHNMKIDYEKDLQTTPFPEVLKDLAAHFDMRFVVNKRAFGDMGAALDTAKAETLTVTKLDGLPLASFLRIYLAALPNEGVTYVVRADHIEITTKKAAYEEAGVTEDAATAAANGDPVEIARSKYRVKLPLVCVSAKDQEMSKVLDELRRVYGLNILVHPSSKEALKSTVTASMFNVPADTALELLAQQVEMNGVIRKGNVFHIGSVGGF